MTKDKVDKLTEYASPAGFFISLAGLASVGLGLLRNRELTDFLKEYISAQDLIKYGLYTSAVGLLTGVASAGHGAIKYLLRSEYSNNSLEDEVNKID